MNMTKGAVDWPDALHPSASVARDSGYGKGTAIALTGKHDKDVDDWLENSLLAGGLDDDEDDRQSNIRISDVIEVIHEQDPAYCEALQESRDNMYGVGAPAPPPAERVRPNPEVYVRILEQPAPKALRFRYECEGRSAGSIPGVNSTPENKTYPTIEVVGYKGRAVVVVSCVTTDKIPKPHPHNLVGKDGCKKGVCTLEINSETMSISFSNLGIQCVKKKDIEEALKQREELRVDPFKTGFAHKSHPAGIDLNAVRLCFQVFVEDQRTPFSAPRLRLGLPPIITDTIYDKKAMSDLAICKLSHFSASVAGGQDVIMLCEKVAKEDIAIRFYEESDGKVLWEGFADFQHANVHKQVAISFRTPTYTPTDTNRHVKVFIQLRRISDGAVSEPMPFELKPIDADRDILKRKRQKMGPDANLLWFRELQQEAYNNTSPLNNGSNVYNIINPQQHQQQQQQQQQQPIKLEPGGTSPYGAQFGNYRNLPNTPSPQYKAAPTPSPPLPLHTDPTYYMTNLGAGPSNPANFNMPHSMPPFSNVASSHAPHAGVPMSNMAQTGASGIGQFEQQSTNSASNLFNMDRQAFDMMPQLSQEEWQSLIRSATRQDDTVLEQVESSFMRLSTEQESSNIQYNNFDRLN